jgi:hypothetical protein
MKELGVCREGRHVLFQRLAQVNHVHPVELVAKVGYIHQRILRVLELKVPGDLSRDRAACQLKSLAEDP